MVPAAIICFVIWSVSVTVQRLAQIHISANLVYNHLCPEGTLGTLCSEFGLSEVPESRGMSSQSRWLRSVALKTSMTAFGNMDQSRSTEYWASALQVCCVWACVCEIEMRNWLAQGSECRHLNRLLSLSLCLSPSLNKRGSSYIKLQHL